MLNKHRRNEAGFSLVSVMVAAAVLGILAVGASSMLTNLVNGVKSAGLKSDISSTKDFLYFNMDCTQSIPTASRDQCNAGTKVYFNLKYRTGETMLARNNSQPAFGSRFGDWWVRASCDPSNKKILLEAKRATVTSANGVQSQVTMKDPLTGKTQDWQDLFKDMKLCHDSFAMAADYATPEAAADAKHLEYYSTGLFRAIGGDMQVTVTKTSGGAVCPHHLVINGAIVPDLFSFRVAQNQRFAFAVSVGGTCYSFGGTQDSRGNNLMMMKQGVNQWRVFVEDDFANIDNITWQDSVWTISAVPL